MYMNRMSGSINSAIGIKVRFTLRWRLDLDMATIPLINMNHQQTGLIGAFMRIIYVAIQQLFL